VKAPGSSAVSKEKRLLPSLVVATSLGYITTPFSNQKETVTVTVTMTTTTMKMTTAATTKITLPDDTKIRMNTNARKVVFRATSRFELSMNQITELQKLAGYHPDGHGSPIEIHHSYKRDRHHYKWACQKPPDQSNAKPRAHHARHPMPIVQQPNQHRPSRPLRTRRQVPGTSQHHHRPVGNGLPRPSLPLGTQDDRPARHHQRPDHIPRGTGAITIQPGQGPEHNMRIIDLEHKLRQALNAIRPGTYYHRYSGLHSWPQLPSVRIFMPAFTKERTVPHAIKTKIITTIHQQLAPVKPEAQGYMLITAGNTDPKWHTFQLEFAEEG